MRVCKYYNSICWPKEKRKKATLPPCVEKMDIDTSPWQHLTPLEAQWVMAIDENWTPATRPDMPLLRDAFYTTGGERYRQTFGSARKKEQGHMLYIKHVPAYTFGAYGAGPKGGEKFKEWRHFYLGAHFRIRKDLYVRTNSVVRSENTFKFVEEVQKAIFSTEDDCRKRVGPELVPWGVTSVGSGCGNTDKNHHVYIHRFFYALLLLARKNFPRLYQRGLKYDELREQKRARFDWTHDAPPCDPTDLPMTSDVLREIAYNTPKVQTLLTLLDWAYLTHTYVYRKCNCPQRNLPMWKQLPYSAKTTAPIYPIHEVPDPSEPKPPKRARRDSDSEDESSSDSDDDSDEEDPASVGNNGAPKNKSGYPSKMPRIEKKIPSNPSVITGPPPPLPPVSYTERPPLAPPVAPRKTRKAKATSAAPRGAKCTGKPKTPRVGPPPPSSSSTAPKRAQRNNERIRYKAPRRLLDTAAVLLSNVSEIVSRVSTHAHGSGAPTHNIVPMATLDFYDHVIEMALAPPDLPSENGDSKPHPTEEIEYPYYYYL